MPEHLRDRGDDIRRVREEKFHDDERGGAAGTFVSGEAFCAVRYAAGGRDGGAGPAGRRYEL